MGLYELNSKFKLRVFVEDLELEAPVSIGKVTEGWQLLTETTTDPEEAFSALKSVLDALQNQVEVARRDYFANNVHPALTGCPGDCQRACPCD